MFASSVVAAARRGEHTNDETDENCLFEGGIGQHGSKPYYTDYRVYGDRPLYQRRSIQAIVSSVWICRRDIVARRHDPWVRPAKTQHRLNCSETGFCLERVSTTTPFDLATWFPTHLAGISTSRRGRSPFRRKSAGQRRWACTPGDARNVCVASLWIRSKGFDTAEGTTPRLTTRCCRGRAGSPTCRDEPPTQASRSPNRPLKQICCGARLKGHKNYTSTQTGI